MPLTTSKIFPPLPAILHDRATYNALRLSEKDALSDLWCAGHPGGVRRIAQADMADAFSSMSGKVITTVPTRAGMGLGPVLPAVAEMVKKNCHS